MTAADSAAAVERLRRALGGASFNISAALLRALNFGDLRNVTAASLRTDAGLRATGDLRATEGLVLVFRVAALFAGLATALLARGLRAAAAGLAERTVRAVVALAAVLRPAGAVAREVVTAAPRAALVERAGVRFASAGFAVRVDARAVAFAAVARPRAAGAAAVLRAGAALRDGVARVVVARAAGALARVVAAVAVRVAGFLDALRAEPFAVLGERVATGFALPFLAAAGRAAGVLVPRVVRDALPRPDGAAVRRPPALTAMARVRRAGGLLSSSVLMIWPFCDLSDAV